MGGAGLTLAELYAEDCWRLSVSFSVGPSCSAAHPDRQFDVGKNSLRVDNFF